MFRSVFVLNSNGPNSNKNIIYFIDKDQQMYSFTEEVNTFIIKLNLYARKN